MSENCIHRLSGRATLLSLSVVLMVCFGARLPAAEHDPQVGEAETVRQQVRRAAQLPGGDALRPLLESPVILWVGRTHLGIDSALNGVGVRYLAVRLSIANFTEQDLELSRQKITLHVGNRTYSTAQQEIPLRVQGEVLFKPALNAPARIRIDRNKSAEFWCLFSGLTPGSEVPAMTIRVEFDSGQDILLDLTAQQQARLALTSQCIGPRRALGVLTIHGQLNTVNAVTLVRQIESLFNKKTERILVEWAPNASPSDEMLYEWLATSTTSHGRENPLLLQFPALPPVQQIVLAQIPHSSSDSNEPEEMQARVFEESREAAASVLEEVLQRVDRREIIDEVRRGHPWSQQAALLKVPDRLGPEALPTLLGLAAGPDRESRRIALPALAFQEAPAATDVLLQAVRSPDPLEAESALLAMLMAERPSHRLLIRNLLESERLAVPQPRILQLLVEHYHPDWNDYLLKSLHSREAVVRKTGLEVLRQLGHAGLPEACIAALSDPDQDVREAAFSALAESSSSRCEQAALGYALARLEQGEFSRTSLSLVERLRATQAAPLLLAEIERSRSSRVRLIQVLGEVGNDEHLATLLDRVDSLDSDEQAAALSLANRLAISRQLEIARWAVESKDQSVRNAALEILKRIATNEAVMLIGRLLESARDDDVATISMALGEIGTSAAIHQLRQFQQRADREKRPSVVTAIKQALFLWQSRLPGFRSLQEAEVYLQGGDEARALKAYSTAILIDPDLSLAYSSRGNLYLRQNKFEKARADFEKSVELDPYDSQGITGVGIVRAIDGDWQRAIEYVEQQTPYFPHENVYLYNTACVYGRAIEYLNKQPVSGERDSQISDLQAQGVRKLAASIESGFDDLAWMQKDPDLATLRELPEFRKLVNAE